MNLDTDNDWETTTGNLVVTIKADWEIEIVYRQLFEPMPGLWKPGLHWQVEAYDFGLDQPPVGFCWVMDFNLAQQPRKRASTIPPTVEYIRVFHTHLRCGIATALLDAARRRWPNIDLGTPATEEGAAFRNAYLSRLEKQDEAGRMFVKQYWDKHTG